MKTCLSDKRFIIIGTVMCIAYFLWFNHPFPLHDGSLTKQEAAEAALEYFGIDGSAAQTAVTYDADEAIIAYLQKEQLLGDYMERHGVAYPLDYYLVEIQDADRTRYEAMVHMIEGTIAGWSMDAPIADLKDETSAREAAESYMRRQRPNELKDAEITSISRPDGSFAIYFKQHDEMIGEAFRTSVVQVEGDTIISYRSLFTPPDAFMQWLEQQDERSSRFTRLTFWATVAMAAAALAIAAAHRHTSFKWTDGLVLAGIYAAIETLQYMNLFPNFVSMIGFRQAGWPVIAFQIIYSGVIHTIFALMVYLPYIGGKILLEQQGMQHLLTMRDAVGRRVGMRDAVAKGYVFAVVILAVQTLIFNAAGAVFHIWWIPDPMLATDNMIWPLLMPLNAWAAAIGEEIIYRLFAVTLFRKLFRSTFVAVVLSSMLWGLGHTAYPVYPVYTRFVEVTLIGIIFGYLFVKFGFTVALFTHAIVDSILMGMDIMSSGAAGTAAGVFYIVLPAIVGYALARSQLFKPRDPFRHEGRMRPVPPRFR